MPNHRIALVCALALVLVACGGGNDDSGDDGGKDDGPGSTFDGEAPRRDGDLLAPSPSLTVPGPANALADTLLGSTTFDASYQATLDILAEGGITTGFNDEVVRLGKAPRSSTFVFPVYAIDLAFEGADREVMASYTLADFAAMMDELGWPRSSTLTAQNAWVKLFADWYAAAEANVDAPDSFAILFIAAMNQKQSPPANIATGTEDASQIRLSLLEIELLIGAIDRVTVFPVGLTAGLSTNPQKQTSQTPCSDLVKQAGVLGQAGQIAAGEVTGLIIGAALEGYYGETLGSQMGTALSVLGIAAKINKLIQQFRFGYIKLDLDSDNPVNKPLNGALNKQGDLRATAGVDKQKYDDAVASGGGGGSATGQAIADCMNSLNLPTSTDARDIAADAENWRIEWSITVGGGSQVLWASANDWFITNGGYQMKVARISEYAVESKVQFDILPQATKATVGKSRHRRATFKAQLHRGSVPDTSTLWGSGRASAAAAMANPIGAILGLTDAVTDISSKWILEGASPKAYVSQTLIEIEPTGLIGSIRWTIDGSAREGFSSPTEAEIETAMIAQQGLIEIVSSDLTTGHTSAYGTETCRQSYGYSHRVEEIVEGSEIVGTRTDLEARRYSALWSRPQTNPPEDAALIIDQTTPIEGLPPGVEIPGAGQVQIVIGGTATCGAGDSFLEQGIVDWSYGPTEWVLDEESYAYDPIPVLPSMLPETLFVVDRPQGQETVKGSKDYEVTREIYGVTVPLKEHIEWTLHWVK